MVQSRLLAKTYLFLRDFMPKGLTSPYAHISGNDLMRYLLCHANEHSRSRRRLYRETENGLSELQDWINTGSNWDQE